MNSLVKKSDVLRIWCENCKFLKYCEQDNSHCCAYYKIVDLDPAQETKRGEWKEKIVDDPSDNCGLFRRRFYCTVCGNWQTYGRPNFCPCCGSDNRGDKNECAENI